MYISSFPTLGFFRKKGLFNEFARFLNEQKTFFFYRGAFAIWHAIKLLKLPAEATILVPAYHCGVEIEAILQAGAKVRFYNIKEDLQADIQDIQQKIDNTTKALFIIHYFGFPQPLEALKDICSRNGIFLIEDCAHALFSRYNNRLLGRFGDIGIFSFRKSLPIPDGGAIVINNRLYSRFYPKQKPTLLSSLRGRVLLFCEYLHMFKPSIYCTVELFFLWPMKLTLRCIKKLLHRKQMVTVPDSMNFDISLIDLDMSIVSRNILKDSDSKTILERRRENYLFLQEQLSGEEGFRIIFKELPQDVCPLFFPILIENRDEMQKRLKKRGINTFIFGKSLHSLVPGNDFSNAKYFSEHNLCLPIHQDMERKHINYMASVLKELTKTKTFIAHLISSNGLYGAEKVMLNLASNMNFNGSKSWVVGIRNSYNPHMEIIEEAKNRNMLVFCIESNRKFDLRSVFHLYEFIKQNDINIIHTHNYKANFLGLLAAKKARIPIVATLHGYIGTGVKLRCYEALDRFILRYFNKVVLVDSSLKRWFKNGTVKYEVVNNGVEIEELKSHKVVSLEVKDSLGIKEGDVVIGVVGRLSKEKGHKYLLEAFAKLTKDYPNIRLLVVGDGELRNDLELLSVTSGIQDKVTFAGFQEDVAKYYSQMDIYVSPSLLEHFPVAILEAMSFGKGIVATNVGGTADLIKEDKFTGILINSGSSEEIYKASLAYIHKPDLRKLFGENAQRFVTENYSLEKMLKSYKKVYEQLIK